MKVITENKKAKFNYEILEKFEAGISLIGQEVKSIRLGRINLAGAYVVLRGEEMYLIGASVPPYQPKNAPKNYNPKRSRKLLLRKTEIKSLIGKSRRKGLTMIPLMIYTKKHKIKLGFAVARIKKKFDKRETIRKRETEREMRRTLRGNKE